MKGFITVRVNETDQLVAVDSIRDVRVVDRYHADQNAVIVLKDGVRITTDWTDSVKTIAQKIREAS